VTLDELFASVAGGCENPDCKDPDCGGPMFLHSLCHPEAKLDVAIDSADRTVHVLCGACKQPVTEITG
jgi:hypothetical protein